MFDKKPSLIGGILLVAGTCIGGGMLALPVLTSRGGFIPSLVIFFLTWLFMVSTGLLFLEVSQWMKGVSNIVSMSERTLGKAGKTAAWLVYIFFFFCLTLAYIVGIGNMFSQLFSLPEWLGPLLIVVLFAPFVIAGSFVIDKVNSIMMVGLGITFVTFLVLGFKFINPEYLLEGNWWLAIFSLPIAFTSFGYQGIIPTLHHYFQFDVAKTRLAIIIGSFLPFVAYIIWEILILGVVPSHGVGSLGEALELGQNAIYPFKNFTHNPLVYTVGQFFAFFALITSFFGVTLGLMDFLADGLKIPNKGKGKLLLGLLVFVPPMLLGIINPRVFLVALEYAGGFGSSLLLGVLPILMVWRGRYYQKLQAEKPLFGGRVLLSILSCYVIFEIVFELYRILF
jgi:tyrosine-specific transport protein